MTEAFKQTEGVQQPNEVMKLPSIERSDIGFEAPPEGGAVIILKRHEKYIRDKESPELGSLDEAAKTKAYEHGKEIVTKMVASLSDKTLAKALKILVLSSDTKYFDAGQRSMETASEMQRGILDGLGEAGLSVEQIINARSDANFHTLKSEEGGPRPTPEIREPKAFWDEKNMDFASWIAEQEGVEIASPQFFVALESDKYKEERLARDAEGPHEMADRLKSHIQNLMRYSQMYHKQKEKELDRLVILDVSHYDLISPFVRDEVMKLSEEESNNTILQVDYGAGISITLTPTEDGSTKATTTVGGKHFDLEL